MIVFQHDCVLYMKIDNFLHLALVVHLNMHTYMYMYIFFTCTQLTSENRFLTTKIAVSSRPYLPNNEVMIAPEHDEIIVCGTVRLISCDSVIFMT